ncbi:MAG TPA: hypothetical protein VJ870_02225, partial [Amycolatopsis sp.]|nr:hypothetical protein [Amycolatopsis sp.]
MKVITYSVAGERENVTTSPGNARNNSRERKWGCELRRRVPLWLKITLGVFAFLFVLGAVFGKSAETPPRPAAPATQAGRPALTYTVTNVLDGEQIYLRDSTGVPKTVRAAGIDAP